jgi:hypothetical protein
MEMFDNGHATHEDDRYLLLFSYTLELQWKIYQAQNSGSPPLKMGLFEFTNGRSIHRGFCICSIAWVFTTTQSESSVFFIWAWYDQGVMKGS